MLIVLLLCSGIDMIGDLPNRVITTEPPVVEEKVIDAETKAETVEDKVVSPEPVECVKSEEKVKKEKPKTVKRQEIQESKETEEPDSNQGPVMIPFPKVDELEPGEEKVTSLDDSEEGYKYYVYRSHNCAPCIWLVNELQKNVDEKDLILSYERTTKSGKHVTYVPVLEVYKDGKLVHQQVGYTSWKTIQGKLGEVD